MNRRGSTSYRADVPETRLCAEHARQIAKLGGEFIVIAEQERTSKPGSLKHNYGGVTTTKKRNQAALDRLRDEYDRAKEQM